MTRIERLLKTSRPWPADAGLETFAMFLEGRDLPQFASFALLDDADGRALLDRWFARFVALARAAGTGFVLDTTTWRANMGWADALGLDAAGIARVNAEAVDYARSFRARHETESLPILINGLVGPSGDGYRVDAVRGGSVDLNRFRAFSKWFSASVTPPPLGVSAG